MQFYRAQDGISGSDTFVKRMWKKYSGDWEEQLRNMGSWRGGRGTAGTTGAVDNKGSRNGQI